MQQWELVLADELIQNAMSFSPPGTEIRVSLSLERSRVALFVDHDGPSIDPRTCLLPFHRLHRKLGENDDVYDSRIGIGLTLLDLMARRSGWSLEFVEGNAGTRPVLMMPVS